MTTPRRGLIVGNILVTFDKRVDEGAIAEFRHVFGSTAEQAAGPCAHNGAVRVDSIVTGETLAWLCPSCGTQLGDDFGDVLTKRRQREVADRERRAACTHNDFVDITTYEVLPNRRGFCAYCGQGLTEEPGGCWRPDPERNNP